MTFQNSQFFSGSTRSGKNMRKEREGKIKIPKTQSTLNPARRYFMLLEGEEGIWEFFFVFFPSK